MDKSKIMLIKFLKYTAIVLTVLITTTACSEDLIEPWIAQDYIQFDANNIKTYSFVYAGSTIQKDTLNLRVNVAGKLSDKNRHYKVKQVKSYGFVYEYDNNGYKIDSAFIELPNQAKVGVHYEDFSNYNMEVSADSTYGIMKVVILRDPSLKEKDYSLTLEVQESEDFLPGNIQTQKNNIVLSDQITQPKRWSTYFIGNSTCYSVMAYYGKVKHQLLIDVTGKRWDDNFITKELTEEYLVFYKNMAVQELNRINDERAQQGLHKLREDDANPNSEVYFF